MMNENDIDQRVAAFIAATDQMIATHRSIADGMAVFFRTLVDSGMDPAAAVLITTTHLESFWQYMTVSHNISGVDDQ